MQHAHKILPLYHCITPSNECPGCRITTTGTGRGSSKIPVFYHSLALASDCSDAARPARDQQHVTIHTTQRTHPHVPQWDREIVHIAHACRVARTSWWDCPCRCRLRMDHSWCSVAAPIYRIVFCSTAARWTSVLTLYTSFPDGHVLRQYTELILRSACAGHVQGMCRACAGHVQGMCRVSGSQWHSTVSIVSLVEVKRDDVLRMAWLDHTCVLVPACVVQHGTASVLIR